MVDPSVHSYNLDLSESDDSSDGSKYDSAKEVSSSVSEEDTVKGGKMHRSRSRTRRSSANSVVKMNGSQKQHFAKDSERIDQLSEEESSGASSSASRDSSSSQSSSSEVEAIPSSPESGESMESSSKKIPTEKSNSDASTGPSCSEDEPPEDEPPEDEPSEDELSEDERSEDERSEDERSEDERSEDEPSEDEPSEDEPLEDELSEDEPLEDEPSEDEQSSPKPTYEEYSNSDTNTGTSGSEAESPKKDSNRESNSDTNTEATNSEDESNQSPPEPSPEDKSNSDTNTGSSNSDDESLHSSSNDKSNTDTNSGTSGSEDEPIQSSPNKSNSDTNTGSSNSDDESLHSSSNDNANTDTNIGSSRSKDEPIQSSPKPSLKGNLIPQTNSGSSSLEHKSMQSSPKSTSSGMFKSPEEEPLDASPKPTSKEYPKNELFGLEDVSSDSNDDNDRVVSKLSGISFDNDDEKSVHEKNLESVEDQQKKALGDKLTVKFKVTVPKIGSDLLGSSLQLIRVPQFIPVESGAFDAETFKDSMTLDDLKDEQSRGDFLNRLKATVRWRQNKDKIKESNSRIVRWSDGSETFHVGAEVFDVMHHKVIDDKNHICVRLDSCYQPQGSITDKMTLRPKLDSTFGQSHVQGLRNRAMNKPQTGVVKVLSDLVANPLADRDRRAKEEIANLRREEREKRREIQMSMRKPRVKPMRHCTADDSDPEQPTGEQDDLESVSAQSLCASSTGTSNTQGIRTNRNMAVNPRRLESTDEDDDDDGNYSDVNDIIDDGDLDGDDEEMSDEPSTSTSKAKKAPPSHHILKSDSDEGLKTRIPKRNTKRVVYSDSDSD